MGLETEQILIDNNIFTGNSVFYFATNVDPNVIPEFTDQAYVIYNQQGVASSYGNFNNGWILQNSNNLYVNVPITSITTNYITGYSFSTIFTSTTTVSQQTSIQNSFNTSVVQAMQSSTAFTMNPQTFVFFNNITVNDKYININLKSSLQTIDTLKIYNNPINSITQQNSTTGVIFGKLEAIQPLLDPNGDNIRIPLKNVPIGIFVSSDQFPQPTSLDSNGDRFYMNLSEASKPEQYFNQISYTSDLGFLRADSEFVQTPAKFQYSTITSENGEYVLQGVPVGAQTIVFEIDLFKQGLTKDEIALNFFPFPTNQQATLGSLPCYIYQQVPTTVLPTWGSSQTGYTQQDISISLDLRKWATYIFPPVTWGSQSLQQTIAQDPSKTLKIDIRDMTQQGFPIINVNLNVCQVPNDLARRADGINYWYNEFTQQIQSVQFYEFGCNIIKLPANIYDPYNFRTDVNGNPTQNSGVWLAAYQFHEYINDTVASRKTGAIRDYVTSNGTNVFTVWSHFDLNYTGKASIGALSQVGTFPYEQPWSDIYPEPYKIPKKPIVSRFTSDSTRTYGGTNPGNYIVEEPKYTDGDLVGNPVSNIGNNSLNVGGFGIQSYSENAGGAFSNTYIVNRIAYVATQSYMYKYESGVAWNETYANNYQPYWNQNNQGPYANGVQNTPLLAGMSSVVNGEKYQRVECGYAYFMRPFGWPRIVSYLNSDQPFLPDIKGGVGLNNSNADSPSPGSTPAGVYLTNFQTNTNNYENTVYNLSLINLALSMDIENLSGNQPNIGELNIYRIVSGGTLDLSIPQSPVIPTYIKLNCLLTDRLYGDFSITNNGSVQAVIQNPYPNLTVFYTTANGGIASAYPGQSIFLDPGQFIFIQSPDNGSAYVPLWQGGTNNIGQSQGMPIINNTSIESPVFFGAILNVYQYLLYNSSWTLPGNDQYNTTSFRYTTANYTFGAGGYGTFLNTPSDFSINLSVGTDIYDNIENNTYWVRTFLEDSKGHPQVGNGISTAFDSAYNSKFESDFIYYVFINNNFPLEETQGYNGSPINTIIQ